MSSGCVGEPQGTARGVVGAAKFVGDVLSAPILLCGYACCHIRLNVRDFQLLYRSLAVQFNGDAFGSMLIVACRGG